MKFSTRGFTLVELMIVIAIIGILAAALFPSLTSYLKRSRDAGRSANLNTIATAVGAFYSDTESYPSPTASGCINTTAIDNTNYFPKNIPQDPQGATQSPCGLTTGNKGNYGYAGPAAVGATQTGFVISAHFENEAGGNYKGVTVAPVAIYTGASRSVLTIGGGIQKGTGQVFLITN